jgi:HAD superfamily hydrolase (TIGR01484 family)
MKPIQSAPMLSLDGVLSDLDDTLTLEGQLVPDAFAQLSALRHAGVKVVIVTGRPAGWVDHIARMWPVDAVVGENGGLWAYMRDGKLIQRYAAPVDIRAERRARLDALASHILRRVPGAGIASDQAYRALDLAIDFCEDVPALSKEAIHEIVRCFEEVGAQCKVSSIHVNGWFGEWDKLDGVKRLFDDFWGIDLAEQLDRWVYFGDSANDEPMFEAFPYCVGVANITPFLEMMSTHPRWVTRGEGGHGFVEAINKLWPEL